MAEFDKETKKDFDLEVIHMNFKACLQENGDVDLKFYLQAYSELARFFRLCGAVFYFVAKDLEGKIDVITRLGQKDNLSYNTVSGMVLHELNSAQKPGTMALLRLHRALELILEFMDRLSKSSDGQKTSEIAADVYSRTMAKHDTWLVQKLAGIAMYTLPTRRVLLDTMCKQDYEYSLMLVQQVINAGKPVYDTIHAEYTRNGIH